MKNSGDNVFDGIPVAKGEASLFNQFLGEHDFAAETRRAVVQDVRKFARWFSSANNEPFQASRVTVRDVTDFKDHLRREKGQAVATVNRCLVTLRRFFAWLAEQGHVAANPAKQVKQLRQVQLAPKGMERSQVRRLLREVELREDIRAGAIFSLFLWTGCRVSDLTNLDLTDLLLSERSGTVVFRFGKGGKQRSVPLPLPARRALQAYLEIRPPVKSEKVFVGERGALTARGSAGALRQVQRHHRREAAPTPFQAHDGAPVFDRQRQRPGGPGANPRPRKSEHDGQVHEADYGAAC